MRVLCTGTTIVVTASSATEQVPVPAGSRKPKHVLVSCDGGGAHVKFGDEDVDASQDDLLVLANPILIELGPLDTHVASIWCVGTARVNVTPVRP